LFRTGKSSPSRHFYQLRKIFQIKGFSKGEKIMQVFLIFLISFCIGSSLSAQGKSLCSASSDSPKTFTLEIVGKEKELETGKGNFPGFIVKDKVTIFSRDNQYFGKIKLGENRFAYVQRIPYAPENEADLRQLGERLLNPSRAKQTSRYSGIHLPHISWDRLSITHQQNAILPPNPLLINGPFLFVISQENEGKTVAQATFFLSFDSFKTPGEAYLSTNPPKLPSVDHKNEPKIIARKKTPPQDIQKEKTQPPVVIQKEKTQPPVVIQKGKNQPPVVIQKEKTQPPVIIPGEKTQPPVVIQKQQVSIPDDQVEITLQPFSDWNYKEASPLTSTWKEAILKANKKSSSPELGKISVNLKAPGLMRRVFYKTTLLGYEIDCQGEETSPKMLNPDYLINLSGEVVISYLDTIDQNYDAAGTLGISIDLDGSQFVYKLKTEQGLSPLEVVWAMKTWEFCQQNYSSSPRSAYKWFMDNHFLPLSNSHSDSVTGIAREEFEKSQKCLPSSW
jgi:hypothetical protein